MTDNNAGTGDNTITFGAAFDAYVRALESASESVRKASEVVAADLQREMFGFPPSAIAFAVAGIEPPALDLTIAAQATAIRSRYGIEFADAYRWIADYGECVVTNAIRMSREFDIPIRVALALAAHTATLSARLTADADMIGRMFELVNRKLAESETGE